MADHRTKTGHMPVDALAASPTVAHTGTMAPSEAGDGTVERAMTDINHGRLNRVGGAAPLRGPGDGVEMRISDADRNGTLRRLHNAVALGLIDIGEFEERSVMVSQARLRSELDALVGDLPGPGAIVTSAADRVELRGVLGSLKRQGEWVVPSRLALHRRMGSVDLDLTRARFAGPIVVIELDMKFGGLDLRLPDGASASIDDVEVNVGSAYDHRKDAPAEGTPHVILTGKVVWGSIDIRGPQRAWRFGLPRRTT